MYASIRNILNKFSLQTVLILTFVIQVVVVVGVIGYLSFSNGQAAVQDIAIQLRSELTGRILQELEVTVQQPYVINQINASSLLQEDVDVLTGKGEHQLWQQIKVFSNINLIYCATESDGAFLGVGRSEGGIGKTLQVQVASAATDRYTRYYEVDNVGKRSFLRSVGIKKYDPRLRPWYKAAKARGEPTWSEVYLDFDALLPTITASTPIYDGEGGQLLGVCATDIILSEELNLFLRNLKIGKSGIAFIAENTGLLIASSTQDPITLGKLEDTERLSASASNNPLIRGVVTYLRQKFSGLENVQSSQLVFRLEGRKQYLEVIHFQDDYNLDWIVILAVPESDFMERIYKNTQITILLCILALLAAILVGALLAKWLTDPLLHLSRTAKKIAQGQWDQAIALDRHDAIGELSRSFARMAHQLQEAFTTLEQRVEDRTAELIILNQELQHLAQVDGLTQVANRRNFDLHLEKEWRRLTREQKPLTLMLCDVDYFKRYNDTYGHPAGDLCLQKIALVLSKTVHRPGDLVARYGGEEFVIILSNTDSKDAIYLAQRIRANLEELQIVHETSEKKFVTLSIGITTLIPSAGKTPQCLILAADRALYAAKTLGRDGYYVM